MSPLPPLTHLELGEFETAVVIALLAKLDNLFSEDSHAAPTPTAEGHPGKENHQFPEGGLGEQ